MGNRAKLREEERKRKQKEKDRVSDRTLSDLITGDGSTRKGKSIRELADTVPTVDDFPKGADGKPIVAVPAKPHPDDVPMPAVQQPGPQPGPQPPQPATRPQIGPPAPSPATTAANVGVPQPAQPEPPEEEPDRDPFQYTERVDRMVKEAMAQGRPDVAAEIQGEYANLITNQFRTLEATYQRDTLPKVQAMQRQLLEFEGKKLPRQLAMQANELAMQATAQQRRMIAFGYGLLRNETTAPMAAQFFSESKIFEPGVRVDRFEVHNGSVVGVDKDGNPVKLKTGQLLTFPVEDAEAMFQYEFGSERKTQVISEGGMLVDDLGNVVAQNPGQRGPGGKPDDVRANTQAAVREIQLAFGAKLDPVSKMIDTSTIKDPAGYNRALAEVEALIQQGTMPMAAQMQVIERYRAQQQTGTKNTGTDGYTGPEFWKE